MHPDNNHIDKKLQNQENKSLPDLSKMDEHWQQMKNMLQPGINFQKSKNYFANNNIRWVVAAFLVVGLFLLTYKLVYRNNSKDVVDSKMHESSGSVIQSTVDTTPNQIQINGKDAIELREPNRQSYKRKLFLNATTLTGRDSTLIAAPIDDISEPAAINKKASLEFFFEQLEKQPQEFAINPKRDTLLMGVDGTVLLIPAFTFGSQSEVIITMKEFYSYEDIISNKLSTCSDDKLLITGGMIHIMATVNGTQVDIQPGKSIRWFVPDTTDAISQMQLFIAENSNIQAGSGRRVYLDSYRGDTVAKGDRLSDLNWVPQDQLFNRKYLSTRVRVLDLQNKPFKIRQTEKGKTGFFYIADKPNISRDELSKELKRKYSYYKVKIRKSSRNSFFNKLVPSFLKRQDMVSNEPVGDSAWLPKELALQYKLKATDSQTFVHNSIGYRNNIYIKNSFRDIDLNSLTERFSVDIRSLGWINCDRFYRDDRPKVQYYVDLKDTAADYYTLLVFDRFKSMMTGYVKGSKVFFENVPEGESAKVISIGIREGKTVAAMESITISTKILTDLSFEETTTAAFKNEIKELDK